MGHVLDHPVWNALNGPQSGIAEIYGPFRRYPADISFFGGTASLSDHDSLAGHLPADAITAFWTPEPFAPPPGLEIAGVGLGLQMVAGGHQATNRTVPMRELGDADVPAMMELVRVAQPGPFSPRTHSLGRYLGVFEGDLLLAMAGERMKLPGYTEVSAVCTNPEHRGRGLAKALIGAIADGIRARGDTPILHVVASNASAIALYEALGYVSRRTLTVTVLKHVGGARFEEPEYMRRH